jgi:hypothetical protein
MAEESPTLASVPSGAVFLSYASQDVEAAKKICGALHTAGVEVWFDQSELRGGDVWDQKIRRQIRDCALFMPVISEITQSRIEGYFRLEWRLGDQRTHLMGRNRAFIVPVCVDATPEAEADVPESFLAARWFRLPHGEPTPAFVARILELLSSEGGRRVDAPSAASRAAAPEDQAPHRFAGRSGNRGVAPHRRDDAVSRGISRRRTGAAATAG